MGVAAGAAAIGAVGAIGGAMISSSAAKGAASTQAAAAEQARQDTLAQQALTREDLAPFRGAGTDALTRLKGLLGLSGGEGSLNDYGLPGLTFQPTQAQLEATPGYQFDLSQGLRGVENSASAQGRGISGPALQAAARFATNLADKTLLTQQGIFQQNLNNVLSPYQQMAGKGQDAANQTASLGQQSTQYGAQYGVGAGNANAAGQVGSSNALSGGLQGLGNIAQNYALYNNTLNSQNSGNNWNMVPQGGFGTGAGGNTWYGNSGT